MTEGIPMIANMVDGLRALGTEIEAYRHEAQTAVDFLAALDKRRDAIIAQAKTLGVAMGKSRKELPVVRWECTIAPSPMVTAPLAGEQAADHYNRMQNVPVGKEGTAGFDGPGFLDASKRKAVGG